MRAATRLLPRLAAALAPHAAWRVPAAAVAAAPPPLQRAAAATCRALSGGAGGGSSSLLDVIDDEIKYERENGPLELPPAPAGWTLQQRPGDTRLVLARREGRERVTVELAVDDLGDDGDGDDAAGDAFAAAAAAARGGDDDDDALDDGDDDGGVVFSATLAKDGARDRLVVECRSDGTYLQILHAALEPSLPPERTLGEDDDDDDDAEEYAYSGPVFEELDDGLQGELEAYLAARGVDAALGASLAALAAAKEQVEYVGWLEKLRAFVKA